MKVGMLAVWDKWGIRYPVTVLQLDHCQVVQAKTEAENGYTALQLGVGEAKVKRVSKPLLGHFKQQLTTSDSSAPVHVSRKLMEFKVTPDCLLPVGTRIYATHFVPGQLVDVTGVSKGKGFQGVMKRHNFKGGRASHGNSLNHRTPGSTGQRQDPGKVFKGKKMPGNMGNDRVTVQNLHVLKIDITRDLLYVKGAVPGVRGSFLRLQDAVKGPFYPLATLNTNLDLDSDLNLDSSQGGSEGSGSGNEKFAVTTHPYNPYSVPMPTMTSGQREELMETLSAQAQARREKAAADSVLNKSKKQLRAMKLQQAAASSDGIGAPEDAVEIVSLWADTAGVGRHLDHANNVAPPVEADGVEIDPMKGVEVADPYSL